MDQKKLQFAQDVQHIVHELGKIIYDAHHEEDLLKILGLTKEQMHIVIRRIVNTLPDAVFDGTNKDRLEELKSICAREFIFFQAQEKWDDPDYKHNLMNFLHSFTRDITQQFA